MIFLSPWMLLGLLAIAAPVAAHLLNRKATRTIIFPTIKLLAQTKAGTSRLYRMRRMLLLALRVLALSLVVLAFAQPVWPGLGGRQATRDDARSVVIVLDASGSMQRADAQGMGATAFERARAAASRALDGLRPGIDHAALLVTPDVVDGGPVGFTTDLSAVRLAIERAAPSAGGADWRDVMQQAAQLMQGRAGPTQLVLLSDFQQRDFLASADVDQDGAATPQLPAHVQLITPTLGTLPTANVGLHGPTATPAQPRAGQPIALSVTARNTGETQAIGQVIATLDSRVIGRERLAIAPGSGAVARFEHTLHTTGDFGITFAWQPDSDAATTADALPLDDRAFLSLAVAPTPTVLLLHNETPRENRLAARQPTPEAVARLQQALAPFDDERDAWQVRHQRFASVAPIELAQADVIALVGPSLPGPGDAVSVADRLRQHVLAGRGVMIASSAATVPAWLERLTGEPWQGESQRAVAQSSWSVAPAWQATSPLSQLPPEAFDSLAALAITERVVLPQVAESPRITAWLNYGDGPPALGTFGHVGSASTARIVVLTTQPTRDAGNLAQHPLFVTIAQTMTAAALGPRDAAMQKHEAGRPLNLAVSPALLTQQGDSETVSDDAAPAAWQLQSPAGLREVIELRLTGRGMSIVTPPLHTPGFYRAMHGQFVRALAAVNPAPDESDLATMPIDDVHALLQPTDAIDGDGAANPTPAPNAANIDRAVADRGLALWPWCVLLAILLMVVEMAIVRRWPR